jgi:sugar phosphate isomerase/epimerase
MEDDSTEPVWPDGIVAVLPAGTVEGVGLDVHLEVAAASGHGAVSLRPRHVAEWGLAGGGRSPAALARRLDDLGLLLAELDPVVGWSDPRRWPTGALPGEVLAVLDLAATLGARAVTALVGPDERWDAEAGLDGLGSLCRAAAERGVLVQVEPFGWSQLWDLAEAAAAVRQAGGPGDGVMVDSWHLQRRGGGRATVAALAVDEVVGVQLSDGPSGSTADDLAADNRTARRFPGEPGGEHHPEAILASLLGRGWRGPVGVEVFGDASADPVGRARRAARSLAALTALAARTA